MDSDPRMPPPLRLYPLKELDRSPELGSVRGSLQLAVELWEGQVGACLLSDVNPVVTMEGAASRLLGSCVRERRDWRYQE